MKKTILTLTGVLGFVLAAFAQVPAASPFPSTGLAMPSSTLPPATATPAISAAASAPAAATAPSVTITATVSPSPDADEDIDSRIEKKIRKHFNVTFDGTHHHDDDDYGWMAVPIVFIVFLTIFGTPVMIVAVILFFSSSRNRAMHKTVRMMVEKGQPVPEALLNPPPIVRQRSDLRRGIKWLLWGVGLMIFFGACSDWDGGAWSLGIIPFLIGFAYIIFWRLDLRKDATSPKV